MVETYQKNNLKLERYFTKEGEVPEDCFEWEKSNIDITDSEGNKLFVQENVEFPKLWSPLARKIVGSKYFFGENGTPQRENSAKALIKRVSQTMGEWAIKQNYFSKKETKVFTDEISYLAYSQKMAFNSPVWFNVGVHYRTEGSPEKKDGFIINSKGKVVSIPIKQSSMYSQTSACFILSVSDTMEGIMELSKKEALLFKYGSGTGTNLSTLRSSREKLSGGGKPSGPLAYWAFYDKVAGIVKSGGKTRRAAKMDILNISHPDILEFIESKLKEEEKLHILIDNGINWREAQESVNYQNTNISIRVPNEFMIAVENDKEWQTIPIHNHEMIEQMPKYKARDLLKKLAEGTHFCGDPGIQYDTTINKWNTVSNSARINATNPCSEFIFIDNSACNLASLNLKQFLKEDKFDVESFENAARITAIAQDLAIDNSSYPTKEIAKNSHRFRPIGLGYANLGSLIMSFGLPYDSDEARTIAASITALMTGKAYETSSEIAEKIGPFKEFEKNKEPMLNVIKMHKDALKEIDRTKLPKGLEGILDRAEEIWTNVIDKGTKYGFRNSQATVLAPTGTIGFMMDADTKGIEPEIGLVQTKLLSDGGTLRLVNRTITPTLKKLEYDPSQIKDIINYIEIEEMMEGAPHIKEEHLPIFDCSNKPKKGKRTISPYGHLKMMAAVQPFLSGGISKTVNLPEEATIEEIEQVYIDAWKMNLKSVALYRDQSKRVQPLNFSKSLEAKIFKPTRIKLPTTREAINHKFNIVGHEGYINVGKYEDGKAGELFLTMSKEGSTIGGLMGTIGTLTSIALQYGVPLEILVDKFKHQKFEPRGLVYEGHPEIKTADSIIDYIFNFLGTEFLNDKNPEDKNKKEIEQKIQKNSSLNDLNNSEELGGFCSQCGTQMVKKGHCLEKCPSCNFEDAKGCGQ
jgi:ribonucleoside-diphosphate reductase alpha chain